MEVLEKAIHHQQEALRVIQRHFLHPLEHNVDLGSSEKKPTLATMTRFYRLRKLNARLQDIVECGEMFHRWLQEKQASAPPTIMEILEESIPKVGEATKILSDNWVSTKIVLDAAYCTRHVKAMEFKITQYHNHLEALLKVYIDMVSKVMQHPDKKKLGKLPIDIRKLDGIEISMPPNYVTHSAKVMHPS